MTWDQYCTELLQAIRQRAEYLKKHPRIAVGQFPRDFIRLYGYNMLLQLERFDATGEIVCTSEALFGHPGSEDERKRLQRGLKRLVALGSVVRIGRSGYQVVSG